MALKLKVLKNVPNQVMGDGEGLDPGEGTSSGPAVQAEARRRNHIYNQSALQGW